MQVDEQQRMMQEEIERQKRQQESQDSGCIFEPLDGCVPDFSDGCVPDLPGCGGGDGCLPDFSDGCLPDFDGCSTSVVMLPLRIVVIIGLMIYGDWDFRSGRAVRRDI